MHCLFQNMKNFAANIHHARSQIHGRTPVRAAKGRGGFALVIALVLMGLLLVLIISLSALTQVEVQVSTSKTNQAQARSNALLGLQVALGQLQQYLGPDKAISAPASLLDTDPHGTNSPEVVSGVEHPAWIGVWMPKDTPAQSASRSDRINNIVDTAQTWLVSGAQEGMTLNPLQAFSADKVKMAAEQEALYAPNAKHPEVLAPKVQFEGGSYAYWVSDEGMKANITGPVLRADSQNALLPQLSQRMLGITLVGSGAFGPNFKRFVNERENTAYDNIYSLSEAGLLNNTVRGEGFETVLKNSLHDLTVDSIGLLTNTRTGGLRHDLSTMLAVGATAPEGRIFAKQTGDNARGGPLWQQLQDFLNLAAPGSDYINSSGELIPFVSGNKTAIGADDLAIGPVIARIQYYHTGMIVRRGVDDYVLRIYYMPALVLWNPYSLPIEPHAYSLHLVDVNGGNPKLTVDYELENVTGVTAKDTVDFVQKTGNTTPMLLTLKSTPTEPLVRFDPGEIKVFSIEQSTDNPSNFYLTEGFHGWEGFYIDQPLTGATDSTDFSGSRLTLSPSKTYAYDARLRNSDDKTIRYVSVIQRGSRDRTFSPAYEQADLSAVIGRDGYPAAIGTYAELALPTPRVEGSPATMNRRRPWLSNFNPAAYRFFRDTSFSNSGNNQYSPLYISRVEDDIDSTSSNYHLSGYQIEGSDKLALIQIPDPELPPYSLGQLQHAQLRAPSDATTSNHANGFAPLYAIGNSLSNPNIKLNEVYSKPGNYTYYDYSWLLNNALWDDYFLSSINYTKPDPQPATHPRLFHLNPKGELSPPDASLRTAANYGVHGAFNVNSTSVQAWKALLGSFAGVDVDTEAGSDTGAGRSPMLRLNKPLAKEHPRSGSETGASAAQGFRALSDEQVESLAVEIVRQVKERGPFLDLATFVNRSTDSQASDNHKRSGVIQAALDAPKHDSKSLNDSFTSRLNLTTYTDNESINIPLGWGMPGFLTQGDVLSRIGHLLAPRSDTFKIRVFGESKDVAGNSIATAYGEAVVQRLPEYVQADNNKPWESPSVGSENEKFGRRFAIISFRWLNEDEI